MSEYVIEMATKVVNDIKKTGKISFALKGTAKEVSAILTMACKLYSGEEGLTNKKGNILPEVCRSYSKEKASADNDVANISHVEYHGQKAVVIDCCDGAVIFNSNGKILTCTDAFTYGYCMSRINCEVTIVIATKYYTNGAVSWVKNVSENSTVCNTWVEKLPE